MANIELFHDDCLKVLPNISDKSIDMILCDLPYGTTTCKWDIPLDLEKMWLCYERIISDNGAIVLFGVQPFTSLLVASNLKLFKYSLVWKKSRAQGFAQAPYRFMSEHEDILIFSKAGTAKNAKIRMNFFPQNLIYKPVVRKGKKAKSSEHRIGKTDQKDFISEYTNYPKSILNFKSVGKTLHATQKPVELLEYLIKTYSKENYLILDNCMGSGSTGVAAKNLNRRFIGIELEKKYFDIAVERINIKKTERQELKLF